MLITLQQSSHPVVNMHQRDNCWRKNRFALAYISYNGNGNLFANAIQWAASIAAGYIGHDLPQQQLRAMQAASFVVSLLIALSRCNELLVRSSSRVACRSVGEKSILHCEFVQKTKPLEWGSSSTGSTDAFAQIQQQDTTSCSHESLSVCAPLGSDGILIVPW